MKLFIDFVNKRYEKIMKKNKVKQFHSWDDYALFLYEYISNNNDDLYYRYLEEDIKLYSDIQTGSVRR